MSDCQFCHKADDGTVACWHMDAADEYADKIGIASAEIYVDDGIAVILRTPNLQRDQRLHVDTLYCPKRRRRKYERFFLPQPILRQNQIRNLFRRGQRRFIPC